MRGIAKGDIAEAGRYGLMMAGADSDSDGEHDQGRGFSRDARAPDDGASDATVDRCHGGGGF